MPDSLRTAHVLMLALIAVAVVQCVYLWPQLPENLASHFDGAGVPNGWSSKTGFFGLYLGILALLYVVFVPMLNWQLERQTKRFGMSNPDYWLAPHRRESTLTFMRTRIAWMGVVHVILAIAVVQLTIDANLEQKPLSSVIFWLLLAYFIVLIGWLISLFRYFRNVPLEP